MKHDSFAYKVASFTGQSLIKVVETILSIFIREKGDVLDPAGFAWVNVLEQNTDLILKDLQNILVDYDTIPNFDNLSPEQTRIIAGEKRWKSFVLYMYGASIERNQRQCPILPGYFKPFRV